MIPDTTTKSNKQTCTITTKTGRIGGKDFPANIVVWNVNGVRARWNSTRNELRSLVQTINPDLLCILESKTNAENLLALPEFEGWLNEKGFTHIFCYWSFREDRTAQGCEGIIIFSKVPCQVTYGIGNGEFDKQARVTTISMAKFILIISYNPQGGFTERSLNFREQ